VFLEYVAQVLLKGLSRNVYRGQQDFLVYGENDSENE